MIELDLSQERAVELILSAPVGVVTGGPGVGKTTTLRAALDRLPAGTRVALAAPTGKAALRMAEATGREARTIHRLLEWMPPGEFTRDASNPIDADLVVIDESSMVDIELFASLLAAVGRRTRIIFVGDVDQIPPVGPGQPFADLIASGVVPVSRLTTLHRQAAESWVCSQSPRILAGEELDLAQRDDFIFVDVADRDAAVARLCEGYERTFGNDPAAQILVPQNKGPAGSVVINQRLQERLNPGNGGFLVGGGEQRVRVGDRVIQTRNDYSREVMNGEIGVVVDFDREDLMVEFAGREVTYGAASARDLRLAYAISIHRSQGSEWPHVVLFCHATHTQMWTRRLLYTAVTRAKESLVVVGSLAGLKRAVGDNRDAKRNSGLVELLAEGLA